jgi:hypothetical protein
MVGYYLDEKTIFVAFRCLIFGISFDDQLSNRAEKLLAA